MTFNIIMPGSSIYQEISFQGRIKVSLREPFFPTFCGSLSGPVSADKHLNVRLRFR